LGSDSDSDMEDLTKPGFHAITSSDQGKARRQFIRYKRLMEYSEKVTRTEKAFALVESHLNYNPTEPAIQRMHLEMALIKLKLNTDLEDFLNIIGFHNTYDAFAPYSS